MNKSAENSISDPEALALARAMAAAATEAIRPHFRKPATAIEDKADTSPVTIADRNAELAMRAILAEQAPHDGIYGEEFGTANLDADRVWVLDPLDGTRAFASGFPIFGTLIAAVEEIRPTLGLVEMNITGERFWGDGKTADGPHGPIKTSAQTDLSQARVRFTTHQMFNAAELAAVDSLSEACKFTHLGGDCYNYCLLAGGHCELVIEASLEPYDIMALIPIIEGAGGVISDWRGEPIRLNRGNPNNERSDGGFGDGGFTGHVLASANAVLHAQALDLLNSNLKET